MKILITGACGVTSRAVARSIKSSKKFQSARLIGISIYINQYGIYEGLFDRIYRVPYHSDPNYEEVIHTIQNKERIDLAIVIPEPEVLKWAESKFPIPAVLPPVHFCKICLSKKMLHETLKDSGLIPSFSFINRDELLKGKVNHFPTMAFWLRDCGAGTTSAKAAIKIDNIEDAKAWARLQKNVVEFMASEYLPGRNFACCMLFSKGELLKYACAERINYFMADLLISGISGNTCLGRLVNIDSVKTVAEKAVRIIADYTGEKMEGLVTVDLRENANGKPLVTEINLRHVAFTSAFANAGANMVEAQILAIQGHMREIDRRETVFTDNNAFLRDIDGTPIWIPDLKEIEVGSCLR